MRKMEVTINGYEITSGTAIADGDSEAQKALFIHKEDDEYGDGDMVVFDYDLPEDENDLKNIFEDTSYQTTDYEVICTFKKDNGKGANARRILWSVQLEATGWMDDTFNGTYNECIQYCEDNDYQIGTDARLAKVLLEDGIVMECLDIVEEA